MAVLGAFALIALDLAACANIAMQYARVERVKLVPRRSTLAQQAVKDCSSQGLLVNQVTRLRGGGSTISKLLPILLGRQQCKILMVGLDAAGKTTIIYQLKLGELATTTPTLGVNVETITYKNIEFMVMDMGGQDKIRQLWSHYYEGGEAIIFVVDSADVERIEEAREELHKMLGEEALKDALLLVYANKQDLPEALTVNEVAESLELTSIHRKRTWYIQACSASSGDGLTDGLEWLVARLAAKRKS